MDSELISTLYEHFTWARNRLLDAAAGLSPEHLAAEIPGGYGTVMSTFVHLAQSEAMWLARIQGRAADLRPAESFADLAELRAWWDEVHGQSLAYLATLDTAELRREIHYTGPQGRPYRRQVWHALLHVPNHQTEHRTQIAAMLTACGLEAPPTDLVVFLQAD